MDKFVIRTKRKRSDDEGSESKAKEGEKKAPSWPEPAVAAKKKKRDEEEEEEEENIIKEDLDSHPKKGGKPSTKRGQGGDKVVIRRTQGNRKTTELTMEKHANFNEPITKILTELGNLEKSKGQLHRFRAYMKAVKALQAHPQPITSGKEAQKLEGIGAKIGAKIDEILESGKLKKLETYQTDPELMALDLMQQVSGIGPAAAKKFVQELGIRTLEDLEKHKHLLNHHQLIGLKHFHALNQKIPRSEMQQLEAYVKKVIHEVDPKLIATTCGSYRRGNPSSSDIDMLITHPKYTNETKDMTQHQYLTRIVDALHKRGFLTDDISHGKTKYMGVCILKEILPASSSTSQTVEKKEKDAKEEPEEEEEEEGKEKGKEKVTETTVKPLHRRIDMRMIPYENYYCGLLYFTGSDFFNQQMRGIALEKGFTLNEYSLRPVGATGEVGEPLEVHSEEDIFELLGMTYKKPEERSL